MTDDLIQPSLKSGILLYYLQYVVLICVAAQKFSLSLSILITTFQVSSEYGNKQTCEVQSYDFLDFSFPHKFPFENVDFPAT